MMKTLQQRDKAVIWHPFTPQKNMLPPIPIVAGKDSLLFAEDGRVFIDAISSWWVTMHGHANETIAAALYKQAQTLEQVIFAGFTHQPAVQLAEALLPLLPGSMAKVFYSDNGSTSTEVAVKMAVQYWWNKGEGKRNKLLAFNNSYHGDTFGAMSVSDRSIFTLAFAKKLFEVVFIDPPTPDNIPELLHTIEAHAEGLAAFIYEPLVQGAGGMKMYSADAMNDLLAFVQQQGILCIADEVMTGFGRTGRLFASAYIQSKPDIICLSKGLTGGTMALGVTACAEKIYSAFVSSDPLKTFFHGHSFTANPLACTAALTSLQLLLQANCQQRIEAITEKNKQLYERLQAYRGIKNIRCLGTILAFEIVQGNDGYLNNLGATITALALAKGVYLRPLGNTVYIMPPYCITDREFDAISEVLLAILEEVLPAI